MVLSLSVELSVPRDFDGYLDSLFTNILRSGILRRGSFLEVEVLGEGV